MRDDVVRERSDGKTVGFLEKWSLFGLGFVFSFNVGFLVIFCYK